MTYITTEKSVHDADVAELYKFEAPNTSYFLTSYGDDVLFSGDTYVAAPISRDRISARAWIVGRALVVSMPATLQVVQDFAFKIAPRELLFTLTRYHPSDGTSQQIWAGKVASISVDGLSSKVVVPSKFSETLKANIPNVYYQRLCNHVLYDSRCGIARVSSLRSVTAISSTRTEITINGNVLAEDTLKAGEVIRTSDGERRLVIQNIGNTLTINWPFENLAISDQVDIHIGCDHTRATCDVKFGNTPNFGGFEDIPDVNPATNHAGMKEID